LLLDFVVRRVRFADGEGRFVEKWEDWGWPWARRVDPMAVQGPSTNLWKSRFGAAKSLISPHFIQSRCGARVTVARLTNLCELFSIAAHPET
jgi:hypothetical protein